MSSSPSYLRVSGVSIEFPIVEFRNRRLFTRDAAKALVGGRFGQHGSTNTLQALSDISFSLEHGDRLALIGHNGSGKTTLMRAIAGIYTPTKGYIEASDQVVPFLDTSLGMDVDATGRQNIEIGCLFSGFGRRESQLLAEEISEFSELGDFLDMPLRTYSAGMKARLGFAIQTARRPKIMVLDEGISAGDAAFQKKVEERIMGFLDRIQIVLMASHSNNFLKKFCNKGLVLEKGQIKFFGSFDDAIGVYID